MPTTRFGEVIPDFHDGTATGKTVRTFTNQYGSFGTASNWSGGVLPHGDIAYINTDCLVDGDFSATVPYTIHLGPSGTLYFSRTVNSKIRVKQIVNTGGSWNQGSPSDPIPAGVSAIVEYADLALENTGGSPFDPSEYGNGYLGFDGTLSMVGATRNPITTLAQNANQGDAFCFISGSPTTLGWQIGDLIFLPTTDPEGAFIDDPDWQMRGEYRTITGFDTTSGNKVLFADQPLAYNHTNMSFADSSWNTVRTRLQNLTQNVVMRSQNPNGVRGHVMLCDNAKYDLRNCAFVAMGRTTVDLISSTNIAGRYSLFLNRLIARHDGLEGSGISENVVATAGLSGIDGTLTTTGNKSADPRRWPITNKDSHHVTFLRCVAHGYSGAGINYAANGNEYEVTLDTCVASRIGGQGGRDENVATGGRGGHAFWGTSIKVRVRNVAAYDLWGSHYGSSFYLNNMDGSSTVLKRYPSAPGVDWLQSYSEFNAKTEACLEIGIIRTLGAVASGPVLWHIGSNSNGQGFVNATPQTFGPFYFYNTNRMAFIWYECKNVTIDGMYAQNAGEWYAGDYNQNNTKLKNVYLEGNSSIAVPQCIGHDGSTYSEVPFTIENLKANTTVVPINIHPWASVASGVYMSGRAGLIKLINCNRISSGALCQLHYQSPSDVITGSDPINGVTALGNLSFNAALMKIFSDDHRGTGHKFHVWHNGQGGSVLAPFSLINGTSEGGDIYHVPNGDPNGFRAFGIRKPRPDIGANRWEIPTTMNNTNALANGFGCAFGEVMHTSAATHADFTGGKVVQTTQIVDDVDGGGSGFSSTGQFAPWTEGGFQGDCHFAQNVAPADSEATWTFAVENGGHYKIALTWLEHANRATNAPFELSGTTAGYPYPFTIDQQVAPVGFAAGGKTWQYLASGAPFIADGTTITVKLTNAANGYVIADAVMLEKVL